MHILNTIMHWDNYGFLSLHTEPKILVYSYHMGVGTSGALGARALLFLAYTIV